MNESRKVSNNSTNRLSYSIQKNSRAPPTGKSKSNLKVKASQQAVSHLYALSVYIYVKIFCIRIKERALLRKQMLHSERKAPLRSKAHAMVVKPVTVQYENTFRLTQKFLPKMGVVKRILKNYLDEVMSDKLYNIQKPFIQRRMTTIITDDIAQEVKVYNCMPERYRSVVFVVLGQRNSQGFQYASRMLCNTETDRWVSYETHNESMFCIVNVYALYYE